uniref:Reverse transcriptase domain-containing protein n=1 Tax=Phanerochaete carnosa TaxID=231932 RepID=A0A895KUH0_9APHY|nr:hypothetical protein K8K84_mgp033 [Phanerochaete carnosa]QRZ60419.1 hypothetical protein [Phanerochaete carnosa]
MQKNITLVLAENIYWLGIILMLGYLTYTWLTESTPQVNKTYPRRQVRKFSYKPLPNIKNMKITLSTLDPIVSSYTGYDKRLYPARLEFEPWYNQKINTFVARKFEKLSDHAYTSNPAFWAIANTLMQSHSYQLMGLYAVFPTWQRNKPYHQIRNLLQELQELNATTFTGRPLGYRRIWIPKPGSTETRPLNIPSPVQRVHLRMLNDILNVWFESYNSPSQHGFRPGLGTTTAWNAIIPKIKTSSDIYEYDFRKFFDSIHLQYLQQVLTMQGMPATISHSLTEVLRSQPTNKSPSIHAWSSEEEALANYHSYKHQHLLRELTVEESQSIRTEYYNSRPECQKKDFYYGVPQGFNISPSLSTICLLDHLLTAEQENDIIQYADDGIIFHANATQMLQFPKYTGIETKASASQWVKQEGIWKKPLKFLGLTYNPFTGTIHVSSRSGKHENYHIENAHLQAYLASSELKNQLKQQGIRFISEREEIPSIHHKVDIQNTSPNWQHPTGLYNSHENILGYQLMGKLMSILYNGGESNLAQIEQNFHYTFVKGSWSDYQDHRKQSWIETLYLDGKELPKLTIFNSSSIANHNVAEWLKSEFRSYHTLSEQLSNKHSYEDSSVRLKLRA